MDARDVECKSALSKSRLPGLDWALNPYRGCSHGCLYCYVQDVTRFALDRPWGSAVEAKVNIASRLKRELEKGIDGVVGVGTVTDPYQPLEAELGLTRSCLSLLRRYDARTSILTKSSLVLRDLDILSGWDAVEVGLSIACVDDTASALLEPGAAPPSERLTALRELSDAGVDIYLMAAPIVPGIFDSEAQLIALVESARDHGVRRIMWDSFNPKPMATRRMRAIDTIEGHSLSQSAADESSRRTRGVLADRCRSLGIELVDAF